MRDVHRFIADAIYESDRFDGMVEKIVSRKLDATGFKVAILGAGPTGLTAAFYLALLGHEVTVFDAREQPGGMLRYSLPEYRLPRSVLEKEVELIRRLGVEFRLKTEVGKDIALNDIDTAFDSVFLAIGTWKESGISLPGAELDGVFSALHFLESSAVEKENGAWQGKKVVVIGGGNAAVDSARTAVRLGADVTVAYRRERKDMPAIKEETEAAEAEGAKIVFLVTPHRIVGDGNGRVRAIELVKTALGEFDASGRRRPVPLDEIVRLECDKIVLAVGERVDPDFTEASSLKVSRSGTVAVDRFSLETNRSCLYAGGDVITGASNVSNAMGYGKKVARIIDERLMGTSRVSEVMPNFEFSQEVQETTSPCKRHVSAELPAQVRSRSFQEVAIGLTPEQTLEEANRCLRCDLREDGH